MIKLTPWPKSKWHPPRKIDIHIPGNTEFWVYISARRWPRDPINPNWSLIIEEKRSGQFESCYRQQRAVALRHGTIEELQRWLQRQCPQDNLQAISWAHLLKCVG